MLKKASEQVMLSGRGCLIPESRESSGCAHQFSSSSIKLSRFQKLNSGTSSPRASMYSIWPSGDPGRNMVWSALAGSSS